MTKTENEVILKIRDLKLNFYTYAGVVKALDGIELDIYAGETLGLVGETGCGKSMTARSIIRLVPEPGEIEDGEVILDDIDLLKLRSRDMVEIRGNAIASVFQDPMTYINPVFTIGDQIREVIDKHQYLGVLALEEMIAVKKSEELMPEGLTIKHDLEKLEQSYEEDKERIKRIDSIKLTIQRLDKEYHQLKYETQDLKAAKRVKNKLNKLEKEHKSLKRRMFKPDREWKEYVEEQKIVEVLERVKMPYPRKIINSYAHELSGGMRQRVMIAMALSCSPKLLIADEATTALDVTIQAQILRLINELKKDLDTAIIFITHDMGVVAETCDRVAVMYAGTIAETGYTKDIFKNPQHPYTQGLLETIPSLTRDTDRLHTIPGNVPNLIKPPTGCRFHPRCKWYNEGLCDVEKPVLEKKNKTPEPGHKVACHMVDEPKSEKE